MKIRRQRLSVCLSVQMLFFPVPSTVFFSSLSSCLATFFSVPPLSRRAAGLHLLSDGRQGDEEAALRWLDSVQLVGLVGL